MSEVQKYLLLDSWSNPIAKGVLKSPAESRTLVMQILDNQADMLSGHEIIQVIGMDNDERALKCRLIRSRYDVAELEPLEVLDASLRSNLRIPVCFASFLYPIGARSAGRIPIRSLDLSCGGIAFYSEQSLDVDELWEIVIPITEQPLVVKGEILRRNVLKNGKNLYAAKFVDLCHDEEKMIRRAVFDVQIHGDRGGKANEPQI